ncbi:MULTISPECIES: ABC-F family ATP-binding cassette domain-containing protein [unclassified Micromonospora]|uniref:ABC-F family ATP-binding cassette domain-containing protein n=1 Tax=unclassified Micromonospora TaxID=2617518 RepID=UPI00332860C3
MPNALLAHDLVHTLGSRRVLDGVSLTAAPGRRIGLIGENGAGKSTLLRLLAGADEPDAGTVVRPPDLGYLPQEAPYDPTATVADVRDDALREARAVLTDLDRLADQLARTADDTPERERLLADYGGLLDRAQAIDAWDAERRAGLVLAALGLGDVAPERALAALSGGQRGRLALAALLIRLPSALLLDEPTNHLDDAAAAFLEQQLRDLPGAVVVASHDRAFLDAVCTDLIDLDPAVAGPVRFGGTYRDYLAHQRNERERWQRRHAEQQEELAELRRQLAVTAHEVAPGRDRRDNEKMGYGHTAGRVQNQIARRVRAASRRLDDLERTAIPAPPEPLRFRAAALAAATATADGMLVSLRDVRIPGRLALDHLDLAAADRLLVTGANGAGKSTLLAVLAGRLDPAGHVRRRPDLRIGVLTQDTVFDRPERTAEELYADVLGSVRADAVPLDDLGLLTAHDARRPIGELSVGQRRRLALALLVADPPDLLLLDEPTNHLSPRLCDELEDALGGSPGAVVVASHDRWLRSRWHGREIHLRGT